MPLIVTPFQLSQRAEFYHQLGSLISAGIPLTQALAQIQSHPPARSFRSCLESTIQGVNAGESFTSALRRSGAWMPAFDIALLRAGEESGRFDTCCKLLAANYRDRAQLAHRVINQLIYPALLFHFAFLIFPVSGLTNLVWKGEVSGFLLQKAALIPVYCGIGLFIYLCQGQRGEHWRAILEIITRRLPLLGQAQRELALARLSAALEALICAGIPVVNAWEIAASASGSPALRRTIAAWRPQLELGRTPGDLLGASSEFPDLFANLYHSGEISGQQDDTLRRLYTYYQDAGSRKLELFAQWVPRLIYFAVALAVAYQVIQFYGSRFEQINNATTGGPLE